MVLWSPDGPHQLVQYSDNKAKMCRLSNKLAPPVVNSVSTPAIHNTFAALETDVSSRDLVCRWIGTILSRECLLCPDVEL